MLLLLAAFAAFVLSSLYLLPLPEGVLPPEFAPYRDYAFMAWSLLMVIGAFLLRRRPKAEPASAEEPEAPAAEEKPAPPPPRPREEPSAAGEALVLLSLLQEKGRFLDFVMEDITAYKDPQVAAASRVVHQGCAAVIREYLEVAPLHSGKEGERITLDQSADPNQYRLVGKVGEPPYSGVVIHRGWKTARLSLPRYTRRIDPSGPNTITPAEVEVR
jgi:hypothetical protein